jgi:hypothetical protein
MGPITGFIIGGILIGLSFIPGLERLLIPAIILFLLSTLLLIYSLIRRAVERFSTEDSDLFDETPDELIEVDEQARQQAITKWRRRARQDRHQRRNPGE